MTASPETTGKYRCPHCGNERNFVGVDFHSYPGADCTCGAYGSGERECSCEATIRQPFVVLHTTPMVEIDYQLHDGGYDSEIGNYNRIECGECHGTVWEEEE